MKDYLKQQPYADRIKVVGKRDLVATGRFDVILKDSKEIIHSRKSGMGWPQGKEKREALNKKIEMALVQFEREKRLEME